MAVKVTLDKAAVQAKIAADSKKVLLVVSNELLKDSNFYAREDTGELIRSSIKFSEPEAGRLIWRTPYAKKAYFLGHPSKDNNPNASLMWAHKAAAENRDKYLQMAQKVLGGK